MDHTRIGPIRRRSTAGLATVVAGPFLLFSIVGSGRAQAPTRSFELLEATIPDLQAALAVASNGPRTRARTQTRATFRRVTSSGTVLVLACGGWRWRAWD